MGDEKLPGIFPRCSADAFRFPYSGLDKIETFLQQALIHVLVHYW